jgi:hypothetical protein
MTPEIWLGMKYFQLVSRTANKMLQLNEAQLRVGRFAFSLSHMERQFVVTHTIPQTEIPTLLDSSVENTLSVLKKTVFIKD